MHEDVKAELMRVRLYAASQGFAHAVAYLGRDLSTADRILQVKEYRERFGCGLKEAYDAVGRR